MAAHKAAGAKRLPPRHEGNFVTGCVIGAGVASVLWGVVAFALYNLL